MELRIAKHKPACPGEQIGQSYAALKENEGSILEFRNDEG
jgi:hypothetical protein